MIVFDIKCADDHVFEAWFANSAAFDEQRRKKLVMCPYCGSTKVSKAPMAARIPAKSNQKPSAKVALTNDAAPTLAEAKALLEHMAKAQKEVLKNSKWVGRDFDANARAMDAGEVPHAAIHGEVDAKQAKALIEDGVRVMPLPFPVIPPEKSN